MTDKQTFILINDRIRTNALRAITQAPEGYRVTIQEPKRSLDQNAHFHALCSDIAASDLEWFGERRSLTQWKALLVSGHAIATGTSGEIIPGIEGEYVAIRESSAAMSVARASSLIEYTIAFCAEHGVELRQTQRSGFGEAA